MKTVEDLKRLREQLQSDNRIRHSAGTQIIVGMGTCGIAAGAREVLAAILDEIAKNKIQDVNVTQTGCIGMCEQEVLVDIVRAGEPRISYGRVTPDFIPTLIAEHVVNGRIVEERVIGKITK
jgi:NADP-reducing hydrogenase subunit HndB